MVLMICDTITCCWWALVEDAVWLARHGWPYLAVYGGLYAVGAAAFVVNVHHQDGVIDTDSWAYMIAHPMRYGGHRPQASVGGICPFYAALFNMLLFVWLFLLLYFAVATVVGTVFVG